MNSIAIETLERPPQPPPARPRLLYPSLVVAAVSVTLFSLLGIAALTGTMPSARPNQDAKATAKAEASAKPGQAPTAASSAKDPAKGRIAAASCAACGTVESVTTVERPAKTSGVGAIAGGLTGALLGNQIGRGDGRTVMTIAGGAGGAYLGNKIEQDTRRTTAYRIVVRMDDGSRRTVHQAEPPNVVIGGPVHVVGNSVVARS